MDQKQETNRKSTRQDREAAALRANLLRRKAREKAGGPAAPEPKRTET